MTSVSNDQTTLHIFSHLFAADLLRVGLVSKLWFTLSSKVRTIMLILSIALTIIISTLEMIPRIFYGAVYAIERTLQPQQWQLMQKAKRLLT